MRLTTVPAEPYLVGAVVSLAPKTWILGRLGVGTRARWGCECAAKQKKGKGFGEHCGNAAEAEDEPKVVKTECLVFLNIFILLQEGESHDAEL
jgi:hypothetical protein